MKLRIRGDSLRLRLTRTEIDTIGATGQVDDVINFAPGRSLTYSLQSSTEHAQPAAGFEAGRVNVYLPADEVARWVSTEEVGVCGSQRIDGDRALTILVEKDFACLAPREGEDESDMFEHPGAADGATC